MEKEAQGGKGLRLFLSQAHRALSSPLLPALSLFLYTHRRMAITGDDVCLDQIVPISRDFTLEEGARGDGWYESLSSGLPGYFRPCWGC